MKIFTKTALACALAAGAVMASAETVEILNPNGEVMVTYSSNSVIVEGGVITLSNGTYVSGAIPGIIPGSEGASCDSETTELDPETNRCIGISGGGLSCGAGTEPDPTETECVPATPPTLNITSSPDTLNDGETTSTLTFQFSRTVTGFTQSDIQVSPSSHTISGFSAVDGDTFRATFNRSGNSAGTATVSVNANSYQGTNGTNGGGDSHAISLLGGDGCSVPTGVQVSNVEALTSLGTSGGQLDFVIPQNGVLSAPVSTGNNPNYTAMFEMVGHYTVQSLNRKMWISDCPGGQPVKSCAQKVGADLTWRWTQGAKYWGYCDLETNKDYYLNVEMVSTCPYTSGCKATTQHKSSSQQNL